MLKLLYIFKKTGGGRSAVERNREGRLRGVLKTASAGEMS
jgi:hypothetical protein